MLKKEQVTHQWIRLDATGKTLGRFASEVTKILRGKHRATFTPHVDGGDGVIIVNAEKIRVTGSKKAQKLYRYYTGFMGGMRETPFEIMLARNPAYILEHAIAGMMPKNRLAKVQLKRLRIVKGQDHDMKSQNPVTVEI